MLYDPDEQTLYRNQFEAKKLGLPKVRRLPRPEIEPGEVATINDLPHEDSGEWVLGWTVSRKVGEALNQAVNAERQRRLKAGSLFSVAGVADPIPLTGRPLDQTVYLALLTRSGGMKAAGVTGPALTIRAGDDVIHTLTPDQMISLVSQAMTWFESIMATSWAMKDAIAPFESGIPDDFADDTHWP